MPRPQRCRRICQRPPCAAFLPEGGSSGSVTLTLDEYETIRLMDREKRTHDECAALMDISRSTVTEIYESARGKIAQALTEGRRLEIAGGRVRLCEGSALPCCGPLCGKLKKDPYFKEAIAMTIAVTYDNGEIFQHFGHTAAFKLYEVENGAVVSAQVVSTNGQGHGALAGLLGERHVDALICGGIGGGAQMALSENGIRLYGGVSGKADDAVAALLAGTLGFDPDVHCDHHDHQHGEEGHACGQHGCGQHGCH